LGIDFDAAVSSDRLSDHAPVLLEGFAVSAAELMQQLR
jgi:hypothetical protein